MKGQHHIIVEAPRLKYEFRIRRNLTILQGDSATGKTTLLDLLQDYRDNGGTPVRITSDVSCEVFSGAEPHWQESLAVIKNSIVFIDEENQFIRTREFADTVQKSSNYYVLITREVLPCLPYSIQEIYGIRTSGRYHFPEQIYHEFYPIYGTPDLFDLSQSNESGGDNVTAQLICEDGASGYLFLKKSCPDHVVCTSAAGNAGIYNALKQLSPDHPVVVVADGAAFGAFIDRVLSYAELRRNVLLYFPESFEWLILKSGIVASPGLSEVLSHPEDYIESRLYFSWERFFTDYLIQATHHDPARRYQKGSLSSYYTEGKNQKRIQEMFPEEIQAMLRQ